MTPVKEHIALLTLWLLHCSSAASLEASTYRFLHPPLRNEEVQPSSAGRLNTHRKTVQKGSSWNQITRGESHTSTMEQFYLAGDFSNVTERPRDQLSPNSASGDLDNPTLNDEMRINMQIKLSVNDTGDGLHKNIPKNPYTESERIFPKDLSTLWNVDGRGSMKSVSDVLNNGGWAMAESTIMDTVNLISHQDESSIVEDVKLSLDIGDEMYFAQSSIDKLDPSFLNFLNDHIRAPMIYLTNILKYFGLSGNGADDWNNVERLLASKNAKTLFMIAQNIMKDHLSLNDLNNYSTILQENYPMAAQALDFVLNLFPDAPHGETGRSFYAGKMVDSYERMNTKLDRHDDFYRGHGYYDSGYGHDMSYSYCPISHHVDPYLLLAGLGAATLLAFVAYHVFVTPMSDERRLNWKNKRSLNFPNDEDLSDLPEVLFSIYHMIKTAKEKYGEEEEDSMDDLFSSFNSLWNTRRDEGCVRCVLKDRLKGGLDRLSLHHLLVLGLAQLMGAARVGQLLDEVMVPIHESVTESQDLMTEVFP